MNSNDMMEIVKMYSVESKTIQHYVPTANFEEIYVVCGLKRFLKSTKDIEATAAIVEGNKYFQAAVGFQSSQRLFDKTKLDQLVKTISLAAIKQKQMSNEELLAQMERYEELVRKQASEKSKLSSQIHILNNVLDATLQKGLNGASITAKSTKNRFKAAIDLMEDYSFNRLDGYQQASILNDVIVAGESVDTIFKRRLAANQISGNEK